MKIHEIHDTKNTAVIEILKTGLSEITDTAIVKNYHPDYSSAPGNLFRILNEGRYKQGRGKYYVITEDDKYICSLGWNEYDLIPTIALMLTRMYITPEHRGQYIIGKTILPLAINEASNYEKIWITANDHNKTIYNYFERVHSGKRGALFINPWPEIYSRFKPIGKHTVYYTPQWVAEYIKETK